MPAAAGAAIEAFKMLEESDEYTNKLWENTRYFQGKLIELGFSIGKPKHQLHHLWFTMEQNYGFC